LELKNKKIIGLFGFFLFEGGTEYFERDGKYGEKANAYGI